MIRMPIYVDIIPSILIRLCILRQILTIIMSRRNHQHIHPSSDDEIEELYEELRHSASHQPEEQGEDLLENPENDYVRIAKLDEYQDEGVEQEEIKHEHRQRRAAERELNLRDKNQQLFFQEESLDQLKTPEPELDRAKQESHLYYNECNQDQQLEYIDAEQSRGSLDGWLNLTLVRRYIRFYFIKFITQFTVNEQPLYLIQLKQMVFDNKQSLQIQYDHLQQSKSKLHIWYCFRPNQLLGQLHDALYAYIHRLFPEYTRLFSECYVRVRGLPLNDSIRQLKCKHLGQMIKIRGVVTTRGEVYNQLNRIYYYCSKCGTEKGPYYVHQREVIKHGLCLCCQSNGPFSVNKVKSVYRNHQRIFVQELPSEVPPGRVPRSKTVVLQGDIIDTVKPGEQVQIIGSLIPRYEQSFKSRQDFPIFTTYIEANYISLIHFSIKENFSDQIFDSLPKISNFDAKFYNSIAPSIYGHSNIKRALTLALFGGVEKNHEIMHRTRGDINVLLLGDPGTAKSQFLKSIQQVFPKSIYTTGKGASAVGLTACVKMDPVTSEWRLQAGALVLADKGICLIDEFDKMDQGDRTSIHQAMEQQTISISKAGIVTSLKARCSVIAAANPVKGRYNQANNFKDNTDLTEPILSRFDVLCIVKDKFDQAVDTKLSSFVINQHIKSHPTNKIYETQLQILNEEQSNQEYLQKPPEFIKQYIRYARDYFHPKLTEKSSKKIHDFYVKIREVSKDTSGMSITTRHLESMVRLCEANARMHLRRETNEADAHVAITVMLDSFTNTQKYSIANKLKNKFENY